MIVVALEAGTPLHERSVPEVGTALHYDSGGLTTCMRINDFNALHLPYNLNVMPVSCA